MVKQFIRNIKYLFLRTEHIRLLDEENISLQRALVEAIDLVADYKRAVQEMQRMIAMIHRDTVGQMESDFTDYENNEEDEVEKEYYKALMKKTTIH
jgi:hypothetical protein